MKWLVPGDGTETNTHAWLPSSSSSSTQKQLACFLLIMFCKNILRLSNYFSAVELNVNEELPNIKISEFKLNFLKHLEM